MELFTFMMSIVWLTLMTIRYYQDDPIWIDHLMIFHIWLAVTILLLSLEKS
jgi:hypothetical protein